MDTHLRVSIFKKGNMPLHFQGNPFTKPNKYNAIKTVVDGITFDSKLEANYYCYLINQKLKFVRQPKVLLSKAEITYRPDFLVYGKSKFYVDVKGSPKIESPRFRIIKKLWTAYGPAPLECITFDKTRGQFYTYEKIPHNLRNN